MTQRTENTIEHVLKYIGGWQWCIYCEQWAWWCWWCWWGKYLFFVCLHKNENEI